MDQEEVDLFPADHFCGITSIAYPAKKSSIIDSLINYLFRSVKIGLEIRVFSPPWLRRSPESAKGGGWLAIIKLQTFFYIK
jgi:hypothetical protein